MFVARTNPVMFKALATFRVAGKSLRLSVEIFCSVVFSVEIVFVLRSVVPLAPSPSLSGGM